jgi:hypothetical protein
MAETPRKIEPLPAKAPYSTPRVVRYGTVQDMTRGTIGGLARDGSSTIG